MDNRLKQLIQKEYKKCAVDPIHFLMKYCQIQHPVRGKVPFHLYEFQKKSIRELKGNRYNVILKARQMGISTLTAGYSLWMMLFHEDKNILVIATKQDVAKNLVTKVRVMHDNLPSWLKGKCLEDNRLSLKFSNGSQIKAVSSSGDAGRSEALSLLILDEAAFIKDVDSIWASAQSTLSTGGSAIVLSTPNGVGNFYHKTWVGAMEGTNEFNPIKLHWDLHPERDQSWRDEQDQLLGPKHAAQECDCDFITSGNTVVDGTIIQWYEQTHLKEPIEKKGFDGNFWVWGYPDYTRDYMVCADVARGDGKDFSAFHVIDVESMEQVAEYRGLVGTKDYGNMLVNVATEYNDALLIIENANVGWAAIQPAIDRMYKNLYYSAKDLTIVDTQVQLSQGFDLKGKDKMVPGFSTTAKTRPMIISKLESYFREKAPIVHSQRLLDELFVFIWNGSRAEAANGYNDDLTMAFCIGMWVRDTALRLRQEGMEMTKLALGGIGSNSSFGQGYSVDNQFGKQNPWQMKVGNDDESLEWLLDKN